MHSAHVRRSFAARSTFARPLLAALLLLAGVLLIPSSPRAEAGAAGNRIAWQGGSWYLQGANLPWFNWGCDFGCGASSGASAPAVQAELAARFAEARASGLHVIRWWTFEGGAWQITRDASGAPVEVNPAVYADFDAALALANQYDLYYDFVLFSGANSGSLPVSWITDATQRQQLAAALAPLFARYKGNPRILSWEVFNEPDFDVWNARIDQPSMQATVKAIAASVHASSTAYVTVGMGFADGLGMVTGLGLDYYQAHWYDYMSGGGYCMRCNNYAFYQSWFNLDAPLVVGETFAGPSTDALQRFEDFYAKGYAGAWAWSLFPTHTYDQMAIDLAAAQTFASRHADLGPVLSAAAAPTSTAASTATPAPTSTPAATATPAATSTLPATATAAATAPPTSTATPVPSATSTAASTAAATSSPAATSTSISAPAPAATSTTAPKATPARGKGRLKH